MTIQRVKDTTVYHDHYGPYMKIDLTRGKFAKVDPEDYVPLSQWNWLVSTNGYATRSNSRCTNNLNIKRMHRLINNTPDGLLTDHQNGDRLDNRKSNLRTCTAAQNEINKPSKKGSASKYKGVYIKCTKPYYASIQHNGKNIKLGYFRTEEEAALAYNIKATKLFGEFAYLNELEADYYAVS